MREISSLQNSLVKEIILLKSKASARKDAQRCVIEGEKEIEVAFSSHIHIETLLIDKQFEEEFQKINEWKSIENVFLCSREVMEKISVREHTQKMVAIAHMKQYSLDELKLSTYPSILILENIEKPGNLGALLRTADAANIDAILCCDMQTDIFNPNVIRNSLGCVFSKQVVNCTNEQALEYCIANKIKIHSTYLHTDNYYYNQDFKESTAIVFGTESTGISPFWVEHSDALIKIPMLGTIDSMNVSNSASILLYEIVRQRR